jgi:hypothetical protein
VSAYYCFSLSLNCSVSIRPGPQGYHLYEICAGGVGWGLTDPNWPDGPLDARKARLDRIVEDTGAKTLRYFYDFGDGWEHTVKIERLVDPVPGERYPRLLEASGRCPPEDVGGPHGYAETLEAINDPQHERQGECKEWILDPAIVNVESIADELATLAKRLSRKSAQALQIKSIAPSHGCLQHFMQTVQSNVEWDLDTAQNQRSTSSRVILRRAMVSGVMPPLYDAPLAPPSATAAVPEGGFAAGRRCGRARRQPDKAAHAEDAEPAAAGELVVHNIERPAGIWRNHAL